MTMDSINEILDAIIRGSLLGFSSTVQTVPEDGPDD